jgi:hypothetical protein
LHADPIAQLIGVEVNIARHIRRRAQRNCDDDRVGYGIQPEGWATVIKALTPWRHLAPEASPIELCEIVLAAHRRGEIKVRGVDGLSREDVLVMLAIASHMGNRP